MKQPISSIDVQGFKQLNIPTDLQPHLTTHAYLYLQPNGWFNDFPEDQDGVTPWITFPAISFLKDIVGDKVKVFEYGCGYSTLFFNARAKETVSVEHNIEWFNKVKETLPNAIIHHVQANDEINTEALSTVQDFIQNFTQVFTDNRDHDIIHGLINDEFGAYASTISKYPKGYFDIIVLDGMARAMSGVFAVEYANDDTVIILDNSDRWHYNHLQQYLIDKGYKRIDFWGPGWNNYHGWCTSVFCKNLNIMNHKIQRPYQGGPIVT